MDADAVLDADMLSVVEILSAVNKSPDAAAAAGDGDVLSSAYAHNCDSLKSLYGPYRHALNNTLSLLFQTSDILYDKIQYNTKNQHFAHVSWP